MPLAPTPTCTLQHLCATVKRYGNVTLSLIRGKGLAEARRALFGTCTTFGLNEEPSAGCKMNCVDVNPLLQSRQLLIYAITLTAQVLN